MIERLKRFNWISFAATLALIALGVAAFGLKRKHA